MSDILLFVFAAACVAAIVIAKCLADRRKRAEESILAESAAEMENAARVQEILQSCAVDLKRQRAAGYGPWLSALLDGPLYLQYDEQGRVQVKTLARPVTPGLALSAVRRTIGELAGGRFNLDGLMRAEAELEHLGEGA